MIMSLIDLNKKYDRFVTFGCSFTHGHFLGEEGSWGFQLSKLLNCDHINRGAGGSSNYVIMNKVIKYCETNDMANSCVGVQFSEYSRREVWSKDEKRYFVFNLGTLDCYDKNNFTSPFDISDLFSNREFFEPIWFDIEENIVRTITTMILLKNYLNSKNIDFIMFEGIGSVKDNFYPFELNDSPKNFEDDRIYLETRIRDEILNDNTFFTKYGPMMPFMFNHDLFDPNENGGHPNMKFVKWWVKEMYEHIKTK